MPKGCFTCAPFIAKAEGAKSMSTKFWSRYFSAFVFAAYLAGAGPHLAFADGSSSEEAANDFDSDSIPSSPWGWLDFPQLSKDAPSFYSVHASGLKVSTNGRGTTAWPAATHFIDPSLDVRRVTNSLRFHNLKIGEEELVAHNATSIGAYYRLKRTAATHYLVTFPMRLSIASSEGLRPLKPKLQAIQAMESRINNCVAALRPIRGPQGETLRLAVDFRTNDTDAHRVTIVSNNLTKQKLIAADSQEYPEDIECSVVLHELTHFAGLVDDYDPSVLKLGGSYPCRAVSRASDRSLMSQNGGRYFTASVQFERLTTACAQSESIDECKLKLTKWAETTINTNNDSLLLPQERFELPGVIRSTDRLPLKTSWRFVSDRTAEVILLRNAYSDKSDIKQSELYTPAQFYAIVYPEHPHNATFYVCSKLAYLADRGQCPQAAIPAACRNRQDWLYQ